MHQAEAKETGAEEQQGRRLLKANLLRGSFNAVSPRVCWLTRFDTLLRSW